MRIFHVLYNDWTEEQIKILASFGIDVEPGYKRLDLEDGEVFNEIDKFLVQWQVYKSVGTLYDKEDIEKSDLLIYVGAWENGYPQPEDVLGYLNLTYDISNYCKKCGMGAVQNRPFRIKKEPKWHKKQMFELTWVFDEIFVSRQIYEEYFKELGIGYMPVLLYKKETVIQSTVQLKLPTIDIPLLLENQPFEICPVCGRKKYSPQIKGLFPAFSKPVPSQLQIFKCAEFFGSGAAADNKIFITKQLYNKLIELKTKPAVWPCLSANS